MTKQKGGKTKAATTDTDKPRTRAQAGAKATHTAATTAKPKVTRAAAAAAAAGTTGDPKVAGAAIAANKPKAKITAAVNKPRAATQKKDNVGKAKKPSNKGNETPCIQKKIKQLAQREQEDAEGYADNTTPGGPFGKVQMKGTTASTIVQTRTKEAAEKSVLSPLSDDDHSEAETQTDVERTTRKRRGRKGGVDIRGAVQDLRQQWVNLGNIDEEAKMDIDDEEVTKHGTNGSGSGAVEREDDEETEGGRNNPDTEDKGITKEVPESEENQDQGMKEGQEEKEEEREEEEDESGNETNKEEGQDDELEGDGEVGLQGDDGDAPVDGIEIDINGAGSGRDEMDEDEYGQGTYEGDEQSGLGMEVDGNDIDMGGKVESLHLSTYSETITDGDFAGGAAEYSARDEEIKASGSKRKHRGYISVSTVSTRFTHLEAPFTKETHKDSDSDIEPPPPKKSRQAEQPSMSTAVPKTPAPRKTTGKPAPPKAKFAKAKSSQDLVS